MNPENSVEFGTLAVGDRFTIDSGVTFEKTSDREAKIVSGKIEEIGVKYLFGRLKPVCVVPRNDKPAAE